MASGAPSCRAIPLREETGFGFDLDLLERRISSVGNIKALIGARHPSVPRPRSCWPLGTAVDVQVQVASGYPTFSHVDCQCQPWRNKFTRNSD